MDLACKEDWELARRRTDAWWHGEIIDRVCIRVTAPRGPLPDEEVAADDLESWWTDPERVIPRLERHVENTHWAGEAFPVVFPTSTAIPAIAAAFLGSELRFINTRTAWCDHLIDDWTNRPALAFDAGNKWWQANAALLQEAAARAHGKYYVGVADLNGPGELLARLRGSEALAFDLIDHPTEVKNAMVEVNHAWFECWKRSWDIIHQHLDGYVFWMGTWSTFPATDLQCDFSIMISEAMFEEFFLGPLDEQTRWVDRTIYHLDGPGATRHLDALLSLPELDAIQWVPGAGAAPMVQWIDLLKKIQAAGKRVWIRCRKDEVPALLEALKSEGLMLNTSCDTPEEADALVKLAEKMTRT